MNHRAKMLALLWKGRATFRLVRPQFAIILALVAVVMWDVSPLRIADASTAVTVLCWVNNAAFVLQLVLLRKLLGNWANPVALSSVILFLFTSGQMLLRSFGIASTSFDLFSRLGMGLIRSSAHFAILGFALYQLGVLVAIRGGSVWSADSRVSHDSHGAQDAAVFKVGVALVLVGVVPYALFLWNNFNVVLSAGYKAYYLSDLVRLPSGILGLSYYLLAGLVLIVVGGDVRYKKVAIIALVVLAALRLVSGDRGDGFTFLITAYLLYATYVSKRGRVNAALGAVLAAMLTVAVSAVSVLRHAYAGGGNPFARLGEALTQGNPIIETLGNLGGTLFPLVKVMELVPRTRDYLLGGSYLASLLLLVPSGLRVGFLSDVAANTVYMSPAGWLMDTLGMTYGPGFTPFAEAFLNFGWFGVGFMVCYGFLMTKLISPGGTRSDDVALLRGFGLLAFLLFAMASRGSFNYLIAFAVRYILLPYCLILIVRARSQRNVHEDVAVDGH